MDAAPTMRSPTPQTSIEVGCLLTTAGGFLDAFTYVGHGKVFANAMTGNVVLLGVLAVAGNWHQALRHIPPILAFVAGGFAARWIESLPASQRLPHPTLVCLTVEVVFLFGSAWLPPSYPDLALVLGISFTAAMQSSSFRKIESVPYNSVVTTGNLRTLADGLYLITRPDGKTQGWHQALTFGTICLCFLIGATVGAAATTAVGNRALILPSSLLMLALLRILFRLRRR